MFFPEDGLARADEPAQIDMRPLKDGEAPVGKQWIKMAERTILVESVNYLDIEPHLRQLKVAVK